MHVAVALLRADGRLLLLSEDDRWTAPSAPVGGSPVDAARRAATALAGDATLVRSGDAVDAADGGDARRVHPFLFDCSRHAVEGGEWVHAPEMRRRETDPWLWRAYDRIRPTVETISADRDHGASWLSVRALAALRDEAALAATPDAVRETAAALRESRPSMTPVRTRVSRALSAAEDGDGPLPAAAERAACAAIDDAVVAAAEAAATAAKLDADRVVTLSRSGTVRRAVEALDPEAVLIAASRPGGEGVAVAGDLTSTMAVTLTSDAGLAAAVADFDPDAALVGADTVTADGALLNKVGTRGLALAADHEGIPLYAVTATAKVSDRTDPTVESAGALDAVAPDGVGTHDPLFDTTPASLLSGYCTEDGILDPADIGSFTPE